MNRYPRPPGPSGHFLLGNLPEYRRDPLGFLSDCVGHYGDMVGLRFGRWPICLINHPELIDEVLVRKSQNFIKSRLFHRHMSALFGQGLLTSEGEFWLRQRRLAAPAFHSARIAGYGGIMAGLTEQLLLDWKPGELRNIHQDMVKLSMRIVAKALFDAEVGGEAEEISRTFGEVVEEISVRFSRLFAIPDYLPTAGNLRYQRGVRRLDRLVYRLIGERRRSGEDRGDLLSMLLKARGEGGRAMSDRQLRDEVVTLFLGGHETTAIVLSWVWYLLARNPAVETRLQEELDDILGGRPPGVADFNRLSYTAAVIREAMRLFPPAWGIAREALNACEIGGYPVAAGTTIAITPWTLHRDARYFEKPEVFWPERWLGERAGRLPRHAFMPFGGGPRLCIGNRFAMLEAVLVLATIAQRLRLVWQAQYPVKPFPSITLRPEGGVWVRVSPRRAAGLAKAGV